MASKVDPEAIDTHRQRTLSANHQINLLNNQIESLLIKHRRSELIEKELNTLPEDVVTYKACGRMFTMKDRSSIIEEICNERVNILQNVESLKETKENVNKNLSESKETLRELLSSKQN